MRAVAAPILHSRRKSRTKFGDKVPSAAIRACRRHLHGRAPKPTRLLEVKQEARP
jgi:hypothetical protein